MLVGADHARRLDPEDVAIDILADVEGEMPDRGIVAERNPRTLRLGPADIGPFDAALADQVAIILRNRDDLVGARGGAVWSWPALPQNRAAD
jgi:hypothetical protein